MNSLNVWTVLYLFWQILVPHKMHLAHYRSSVSVAWMNFSIALKSFFSVFQNGWYTSYLLHWLCMPTKKYFFRLIDVYKSVVLLYCWLDNLVANFFVWHLLKSMELQDCVQNPSAKEKIHTLCIKVLLEDKERFFLTTFVIYQI